jgi:hypothetical protein
VFYFSAALLLVRDFYLCSDPACIGKAPFCSLSSQNEWDHCQRLFGVVFIQLELLKCKLACLPACMFVDKLGLTSANGLRGAMLWSDKDAPFLAFVKICPWLCTTFYTAVFTGFWKVHAFTWELQLANPHWTWNLVSGAWYIGLFLERMLWSIHVLVNH